MTTNNNQPEQNNPQPVNDYCQATFNTPGGEIVNNYRCNQKQLSVADMWHILKKGR